MKITPFAGPRLIGLDIRPTGLHMLQLKKTQQEWQITCMAAKELPTVFMNDKVRSWDKLSGYISDFVVAEKFPSKSVAIALPKSVVRTDRIQLPMEWKEDAIEAEIYQRVGEDTRVDFTITSQIGHKIVNLIMVAADYLTNYVACVEEAGLKVEIVDVEEMALLRTQSLSSIPKNYEIAYGLAMRELPPWSR